MMAERQTLGERRNGSMHFDEVATHLNEFTCGAGNRPVAVPDHRYTVTLVFPEFFLEVLLAIPAWPRGLRGSFGHSLHLRAQGMSGAIIVTPPIPLDGCPRLRHSAWNAPTYPRASHPRWMAGSGVQVPLRLTSPTLRVYPVRRSQYAGGATGGGPGKRRYLASQPSTPSVRRR